MKTVENFLVGVKKFFTLFWNSKTVDICVVVLSFSVASHQQTRRCAQQAAAMAQAGAAEEEGTAAKAAALLARTSDLLNPSWSMCG